jgi:hypothetical protein
MFTTIAVAADAPANPEWVVTADGAFVVHLSANVAWPRCMEGQRWTGQRCEGQALRMNQTEALALARARHKADGVAWRLPHLQELQLLARRNTRPPTPERPLLPGADDAWCWSSTAAVDTSVINEYSYGNVVRGVNAQNMARAQFLHAWAVNTATAEARKDVLKQNLLQVRLVRPLD